MKGAAAPSRYLYTDSPARDVVPFVIVAMAGLATLLLPPYAQDDPSFLVALVCMAGAGVLATTVAVLPPTNCFVAVPPLAFFVVVAVARHAAGGGASGVATLILLPVLWISLYGTRRQLWLASLATALVFIVPLLLFGPPAYDASDWRRGVTWSLVVLLVCPRVQLTVQQLRASLNEQKRLAAEFSSVLRAATEHSIIATDLEGTITLFSEGAERMLGYTAAELVGRSTPAVLHDPDEVAARASELGIAPGFAVFTHDVPADGATGHAWTYRRHDGATLRVRLTTTRLMGSDGMQDGWMGIARDVTAEELAQAELTTVAQRWRTLLDHLPDTSVVVVGPNLEYRLAVGAGLERQGMANIQGQTLFETSGAANVALLEPLFRAALQGRPGATELRATKTGALNEVQLVPLPAHNGESEALVVFRDVTEARQREAELRVARDHFAKLFEEAPHGELLLDAEGTVLQVNPAYCSLMELKAEDLRGRHIHELPFVVSADEPSRLPELMSGELSRLSLERTIRISEQKTVVVAITVVALRDQDGKVTSLLVSLVDVSVRKRYEEYLSELADNDSLTGLANRRKFDAELRLHLDRCRRYGASGAVLLLDLDHFKQINDTLGHSAGDEVISSTATLLRERVRKVDVVARLGGDEFAVLLSHVDGPGAEIVARDIVDLVRERQAALLDGSGLPRVTASVGVALIKDPTVDPSDVLRTADLAMYDAKKAGRGRFALR